MICLQPSFYNLHYKNINKSIKYVDATHVLESFELFQRRMRTIKVVKKPDSHLIQCPRLWHSSWGDVFGKVGNGSMELNIFLLPFISLSWALVFVSGS
jgi:hypothetical protein